MTESPVLQGVLAINKPTGITSVDVLRTIQDKFRPSALFAPLLKQAATLEAQKTQRGRHSRRRARDIKIGHGGTLDPLATGVLIAGIGSGTKTLGSFLGCTKSYETVVVFGVATDTYDVVGQVTDRKSLNGIDRAAVEKALAAFRGSIKQRPPTFSARWINGERMYDLARRGEKIPEQALQERDMQVDVMELLDFWDAGEHSYVLRTGEPLKGREGHSGPADRRQKKKRKRDEADLGSQTQTAAKEAKIESLDYVTERKVQDPRDVEDADEVKMTGALPTKDEIGENGEETAETNVAPADEQLGPAARIRMTVSSGFYVRSLCHDLGKSLGSAGFMAELVRTRQAEFELGKNVLEFDELSKDEDSWGPKVHSLLNSWQQSQTEKQQEETKK